MSLKEREDAIAIIQNTIMEGRAYDIANNSTATMILNRLLQAGYLNDKTTVSYEEIKEEIEKAVFKCKVEE